MEGNDGIEVVLSPHALLDLKSLEVQRLRTVVTPFEPVQFSKGDYGG